MPKKVKYTIIIITIAILSIGGGIYYLRFGKQIPPNPKGTIGNTAGNLYNNGLYCESDGIVYFANPYDHYFLYSMKVDESSCQRVNTSMVRNINAGKEYLYYYQFDSKASTEYGFINNLGGIFRSSKKGGRTVCVKKNLIGNLLLLENDIYYLNYDSSGNYNLYSIKTDGKSDQLVTEGYADPSCICNGKIYFTINDSAKNHFLNSYNPKTKELNVVFAKDVWYPQCFGSYIYYLDVHNGYALCRYDTASGTDQILTSERIDCFNVTGEYIYYQVNSKDDPYLGMMYYDGSMQTRVISGNYTNLNCSSKYLYFNAFGNDTPIYHVPLGSTQISNFTAGMDAMKKY